MPHADGLHPKSAPSAQLPLWAELTLQAGEVLAMLAFISKAFPGQARRSSSELETCASVAQAALDAVGIAASMPAARVGSARGQHPCVLWGRAARGQHPPLNWVDAPVGA